MTKPIIYMIRHGEKTKIGDKDEIGLNTLGEERANELITVFGKDSGYNIGNIFAEERGDKGKRLRPYQTVQPLADHLGIKIKEIDRDQPAKVVEKALDPKNPGNVLICWEHGVLSKIAAILMGMDPDSKDAPVYPGDHFDLIWTFEPPHYSSFTTTTEKGTAGPVTTS